MNDKNRKKQSHADIIIIEKKVELQIQDKKKERKFRDNIDDKKGMLQAMCTK